MFITMNGWKGDVHIGTKSSARRTLVYMMYYGKDSYKVFSLIVLLTFVKYEKDSLYKVNLLYVWKTCFCSYNGLPIDAVLKALSDIWWIMGDW